MTDRRFAFSACLLRGIVVLVLVVNLSAAVLTDKGTQAEAEERCKARGGLVAFKHFNPPPGTSHHGHEPPKNMRENLNITLHSLNITEGESVWVSGRANYSGYVAWHTCLNTIENITEKLLPPNTSTIYNCWKQCTSKQSYFIGLKMDWCYCLQESDLNSKCCTNNYTGNGIHIYRVIDIGLNVSQPFQCVQVNKTGSYTYDKCSGRYPGLCTKLIDGERNLKCKDKKIEELCIFNDSKTWIDNREQCVNNSGKLFPYFDKKIEQNIENSKRYSLGAFRSFNPFSKNPLLPNLPCLSITRVDGKLWLEPDNCLEKRRYLCKNYKSTDEEQQDDGGSGSSNGGDGDEGVGKKSRSPAYTSEITISTETNISCEQKITTTHPTNDKEEQDDGDSGSSNGGDGDEDGGNKLSSPAYTSEIPISTETKISYKRKITTSHPTNDLDDINTKGENNKNGYITILSVCICLVVAIIAVVIIIAYVKRRDIQKCYINRKNTSTTQAVIKLGRKTSVLSIENHSPDAPQQEHYAEIDIHNTSTSSETNAKIENEYDHVQHESSTTVSKNAKSHGGQYNIYDRSVLRVTDDDYDTLGNATPNSRNTEENMYSHTIDVNTRLAHTSGLYNTLGQTTFIEINIDSNDYHKLSDVACK